MTKISTTHSYAINGTNGLWVLPKSEIISAIAAGSPLVEYGVSGNHILLRGAVFQTAFAAGAIALGGTETRLVVAGTGAVVGQSGILMFGEGERLVNHGLVASTVDHAVLALAAGDHITNTGTILGNEIGIRAQGDDVRITNSGAITGHVGIEFSAAVRIILSTESTVTGSLNAIVGTAPAGIGSRIVNHGLITSGADNFAIILGASYDTIVNDGFIYGTVILGAGDDTFDNRGGQIDSGAFDGVVGAAGNDTLITDRSDITLFEDPGNGYDTVRAFSNYWLGAEVERLILDGQGDYTGKGNNGNNVLAGNDGNNALFGSLGSDLLYGGKGDDRLNGGVDVDFFVFSTGDGDDLVIDFIATVDKIDLSDVDAITSLADLKAHHLTIDGPDLVITSGTDSIVLRDTNINELVVTDFIF